jgi:hypothetical protein
MTDLDWPFVAQMYMDAYSPAEPVGPLIAQLQAAPPIALNVGLRPDEAAAAKPEACRFLLFAIRLAVADHALSEAELRDLRHMARLLRVNEGDLLEEHREEVRDLLAQELERLLEDRTIDPIEAVHKVKLQELLGLGYDQFIAMTHPVVDRVVNDLRQQLNPEGLTRLSSPDVEWLQRQIAAMDTVYDLRQWRRTD